MSELLTSLTPAQREAVEHRDGALLVLAGPGSGKTRVVTHRIARLVECGVEPRQILALTFTNKAADEMKGRLAQLVPGADVWIGTFHRFCARLLRTYAPHVGLDASYTIYDTADSLQALRRAIERLDFDPSHYTPERIHAAIGRAKNNLITAEQFEARHGDALQSVVARIYPQYQAQLLASNAVDFDDLLLHVAVLLRENAQVRRELDERYRYTLVDEYQDTNLAQYMIVRAISIDYPNLAVTGDPDQSIYGWRGANLSNILEFEKDYPRVKVVRLEQNYRSTQRIVRVAAQLIAHNTRRKAKELYTHNVAGAPVRFTSYATNRAEADAVAMLVARAVREGSARPRDFAVLYRVNALSRTLEFALRDQGIAYQMVNGQEFYQRKEIKDVLAYLQLLNNPRDDVALARIINTPPRGIGKKTLERLGEYAAEQGLSRLEAARRAGLIDGLPARAALALARFVSFFDRLSTLAARPVEEILRHVLVESGYQSLLADSESEEDQDRLANIEELITAAREFDEPHAGEGHLEEFLENACLVNETDNWETTDDRVTLMTLHASKGLEFPVVFIVALEERLIPHERSRERPDHLEEERRLLFVGMTRAQRELYLSRAVYREFRGTRRMSVPSQFLTELPLAEMELSEEAVSPPLRTETGEESEYQPRISESDDTWTEHARELDPSSTIVGGASATTATLATRLSTAAELAGDVATNHAGVSPDAFDEGMLVVHPDYGLGKVVGLSGNGSRRNATVQFASAAGQKTFRLQHSSLCPAKPPPATS